MLARQQLKAARRTKTEMILLRADVAGEDLAAHNARAREQ